MTPGKLEYVMKNFNVDRNTAYQIIGRMDLFMRKTEDMLVENGAAEDGNQACIIVNNVFHELVGWIG